MKTVILFIISIFTLYYIILKIAYSFIYRDKKKIEENIKKQEKQEKHITRTGGLENDRLNERP